jgi:hypothetical protein
MLFISVPELKVTIFHNFNEIYLIFVTFCNFLDFSQKNISQIEKYQQENQHLVLIRLLKHNFASFVLCKFNKKQIQFYLTLRDNFTIITTVAEKIY